MKKHRGFRVIACDVPGAPGLTVDDFALRQSAIDCAKAVASSGGRVVECSELIEYPSDRTWDPSPEIVGTPLNWK